MSCNNYSMNNKANKVNKVSRRRRRPSKGPKVAKSRPKKVSRRRSGKRKSKSRGGYVALPTDQVSV